MVSFYMLSFLAYLYIVLEHRIGLCSNLFNISYIHRNSDLGSSAWFVFHSRQERKTYVPSPPRMIRRQFQKPKPNLGRAHARKEESSIEKDRADQSEARKPEDNLLQHGDSDTQFLQKVSLKKMSGLYFVSIVKENIKKYIVWPFVL